VTGERARLFVALELPAEARTELISWRRGVLDRTQALRAVPAEALHVTLCFLGDVSAAASAAIGETCAEALERVPAGELSLSLSQPLWLPRRRPRVLAVAVEDHGGGLAALQRELSAALTHGGWYKREPRPFLAHVTVARVRASDRIRPLELGPPHALAFAGSIVTLYRSQPGSQYTPLRRLSTQGSPSQ
jgi:RNA 2',3'-cyclic 3'-phosphodiesterase